MGTCSAPRGTRAVSPRTPVRSRASATFQHATSRFRNLAELGRKNPRTPRTPFLVGTRGANPVPHVHSTGRQERRLGGGRPRGAALRCCASVDGQRFSRASSPGAVSLACTVGDRGPGGQNGTCRRWMGPTAASLHVPFAGAAHGRRRCFTSWAAKVLRRDLNPSPGPGSAP